MTKVYATASMTPDENGIFHFRIYVNDIRKDECDIFVKNFRTAAVEVEFLAADQDGLRLLREGELANEIL